MDKKSCAAEILDIMEAFSKHAKLTESVKNKQIRKIIIDQQLHVPQKSKYIECFHVYVRMTAYRITM